MEKRPFDIDLAIRRIRKAVEPFPKAAMFELERRVLILLFSSSSLS